MILLRFTVRVSSRTPDALTKTFGDCPQTFMANAGTVHCFTVEMTDIVYCEDSRSNSVSSLRQFELLISSVNNAHINLLIFKIHAVDTMFNLAYGNHYVTTV